MRYLKTYESFGMEIDSDRGYQIVTDHPDSEKLFNFLEAKLGTTKNPLNIYCEGPNEIDNFFNLDEDDLEGRYYGSGEKDIIFSYTKTIWPRNIYDEGIKEVLWIRDDLYTALSDKSDTVDGEHISAIFQLDRHEIEAVLAWYIRSIYGKEGSIDVCITLRHEWNVLPHDFTKIN